LASPSRATRSPSRSRSCALSPAAAEAPQHRAAGGPGGHRPRVRESLRAGTRESVTIAPDARPLGATAARAPDRPPVGPRAMPDEPPAPPHRRRLSKGIRSMQTVLDELAWRDLVVQTTGREALGSALADGPISLYCGFDPTA